MSRQSTSQQLARLLALPAWVAEHPGATIAQAAAHFEVSPSQIEADVNTLWVSGLPGGMPGELVDFDAFDFEAGRLRLAESLGLDRPVRLSRKEALSLILALRVLRTVLADDVDSLRALDSAQAALTQLLSQDSQGGLEFATDRIEDRAAQPGGLGTARAVTRVKALPAVLAALSQGRRLRLSYISATDTRSEREVDPLELSSDGAHLFLRGWCLSARARRMFRLDRIVEATVLDTPAVAHRASRRSRAGSQARQAPTATFTLRSSGRWLTEQVDCLSVEQLPQGQLRAVVEGRDRDWLVTLALSAGSHLLAVDPADLAQQVADAAQRALDTYGQ